MSIRTKAEKPGEKLARLMLLGGISENRFPMDLIRAFIDHSGGGDQARIFLIPAATEQVELLTGKYRNALEEGACRQIHTGCFEDRSTVDSEENLSLLEWASAVFFTGGDQLRLLNALRETKFATRLRERFNDGLNLGGSSAGAMALGNPVIIRGQPEDYMDRESIRIEPGLELLPGVIIDTHMTERGRLGRLINAVSRYPGSLGLGLDENTGVFLDSGGGMTVHGPGSVFVLDAHDWVGNYPEKEPNPHELSAECRLTVENVVLNIYKSGDRQIPLRLPVGVTIT